KARQGLIKDFTGIDSPFEEPEHPDLILETTTETVEQTMQRMIVYILPLIQFKPA
nr:adenylyl-sulfate kinase [Deltaproteobacteria bacterium]